MSDDDLAEVWARSLADLADMNIEPHQRAWLQLTRPLGLVENTALIAAPNDFVKEQLETRLRALITNALSRELARSIQLAVTVDPAATADLNDPSGRLAGRPRSGHPGDDDITGPIPVTARDTGDADGYGGLAGHTPHDGNGHASLSRSGPPAIPRPPARRASTRSTPSRRSSSDRVTALRMRPRSPSPKRPPRPTTRCSSTATRASARRTCSTRSDTTRRASTRA